MSAFSVENPHDGKMFENYTRFEWGVEVGVVTIFVVRLFVPHEFDMYTLLSKNVAVWPKWTRFALRYRGDFTLQCRRPYAPYRLRRRLFRTHITSQMRGR